MKVLFGASGHGKIAGSILRQLNEPFIFVDDNPKLSTFFGTRVIVGYENLKDEHAETLISIGNNVIRKKVAREMRHSFFTLISPTTYVDSTVKIGEGTLVCQNATVQVDCKIGKHVIINTASSIDHDCVIEDFVHVSPQATICGAVKIGEGTHIGANVTVLPNLTIGKNTIVGAGSVVINDIPDNVTVVGNPAKIIKTHER